MKVANLAECFHMSCEMHGTGAANLSVALAIHNTGMYERGLLHPFIDYDAPKAYQNRIDDEMDADGYVHGRDLPGLGQDLNMDYILGNLVRGLTQTQYTQLTEVLLKEWKEIDLQWIFHYTNNNEYMPPIPKPSLNKVLTKKQQKMLDSVQSISISFGWNNGFGANIVLTEEWLK